MWNLFKGNDAKYKEAKNKMYEVFLAINTNIPDYDPYSIPATEEFTDYPEGSLADGNVKQKTEQKTSTHVVWALDYTDFGQLKPHTHYGYYEYVFVISGVFKTLQGDVYIKDDGFLIKGTTAHSTKCVSGRGSLLLVLSKDKSLAKFSTLKKYL